mgnify:FL=1
MAVGKFERSTKGRSGVRTAFVEASHLRKIDTLVIDNGILLYMLWFDCKAALEEDSAIVADKNEYKYKDEDEDQHSFWLVKNEDEDEDSSQCETLPITPIFNFVAHRQYPRLRYSVRRRSERYSHFAILNQNLQRCSTAGRCSSDEGLDLCLI